MSDGGKGSGRRPGSGYQSGWDRIFAPAPAGQSPAAIVADNNAASACPRWGAGQCIAPAAPALHPLASATVVQMVKTPLQKGVCTCTCTRSVGVGGASASSYPQDGKCQI
jgi:hypothetical protein